jgi:hypothetical protein
VGNISDHRLPVTIPTGFKESTMLVHANVQALPAPGPYLGFGSRRYQDALRQMFLALVDSLPLEKKVRLARFAAESGLHYLQGRDHDIAVACIAACYRPLNSHSTEQIKCIAHTADASAAACWETVKQTSSKAGKRRIASAANALSSAGSAVRTLVGGGDAADDAYNALAYAMRQSTCAFREMLWVASTSLLANTTCQDHPPDFEPAGRLLYAVDMLGENLLTWCGGKVFLNLSPLMSRLSHLGCSSVACLLDYLTYPPSVFWKFCGEWLNALYPTPIEN